MTTLTNLEIVAKFRVDSWIYTDGGLFGSECENRVLFLGGQIVYFALCFIGGIVGCAYGFKCSSDPLEGGWIGSIVLGVLLNLSGAILSIRGAAGLYSLLN